MAAAVDVADLEETHVLAKVVYQTGTVVSNSQSVLGDSGIFALISVIGGVVVDINEEVGNIGKYVSLDANAEAQFVFKE
ncbi:hypothetical protein N7540_000873 [Penicillium herquei]|nr:hypothetical protein N7540_000873 [Penicillium herquei]